MFRKNKLTKRMAAFGLCLMMAVTSVDFPVYAQESQEVTEPASVASEAPVKDPVEEPVTVPTEEPGEVPTAEEPGTEIPSSGEAVDDLYNHVYVNGKQYHDLDQALSAAVNMSYAEITFDEGYNYQEEVNHQYILGEGHTLVVTNSKAAFNNRACVVVEGGSLTLNNCEWRDGYNSSYGTNQFTPVVSLNVKKGDFVQNGGAVYHGILTLSASGHATIKDGIFSSEQSMGVWGEMTVKGNSVLSTEQIFSVYDGAKFTLDGGKIYGASTVVAMQIYGGTVKFITGEICNNSTRKGYPDVIRFYAGTYRDYLEPGSWYYKGSVSNENAVTSADTYNFASMGYSALGYDDNLDIIIAKCPHKDAAGNSYIAKVTTIDSYTHAVHCPICTYKENVGNHSMSDWDKTTHKKVCSGCDYEVVDTEAPNYTMSVPTTPTSVTLRIGWYDVVSGVDWSTVDAQVEDDTIPAENVSKEWDGKTFVITVSNLAEKQPVKFRLIAGDNAGNVKNYPTTYSSGQTVMTMTDENTTITVENEDELVYNGGVLVPQLKIVCDGQELTKSDYYVYYYYVGSSYTSSVKAPREYRVEIEGRSGGKFKGKVSTTFTVRKASMEDITLELDGDNRFEFDGKEKTQYIKIYYKGKIFAQDQFEITGNKQIDAGTHAITVTPKENGYVEGKSKKITFEIKGMLPDESAHKARAISTTKHYCDTCGLLGLHDTTGTDGKCSVCGYAIPETQISITNFAYPGQLTNANNFTLYKSKTSKGVPQKVNFSNGKTWYIAGGQRGQLVLIFDPENTGIPKRIYDSCTSTQSKTYQKNIATYVTKEPSSWVNPSHYGLSDIRTYLNTELLNTFTAAEQSKMVKVPVFTGEERHSGDIYFTNDYLYLPDITSYALLVGYSSANGLDDGLMVGYRTDVNAPAGSPFCPTDKTKGITIWTRSTPWDNNKRNIITTISTEVKSEKERAISETHSVIPVMHLDLDTVLFASAVETATEDASIGDGMNFRFDGTEKIKSIVYYDEDGIRIIKGADDEYLYVLYHEGDEDKVYSKEITEDVKISAACMGLESLNGCRVWVEKKNVADNLTYAVMAIEGDSGIKGHTFVMDGDGTHSCTFCGYAEAHTYAADCLKECTKCEYERPTIGDHEFDTHGICKHCGIVSFAKCSDVNAVAEATLEDGEEHSPVITVYYAGTLLVEGEDYTAEEVKASVHGTYAVELTGLGRFCETTSVEWEVTPGEIYCKELPIYSYTGKAITPSPVIYSDGVVLTLGKDYTLSYKNNTKAATKDAVDAKGKSIAPTMTITGKGNFSGKIDVKFTIAPASLSSVKVDDIFVASTGRAIKVAPVVKKDGKALKFGTDYTLVEVIDGVENPVTTFTEGKHTVTVKGKGNYTDTTDFEFVITKDVLASKLTVTAKPSFGKNWSYQNGEEIKPHENGEVKITYNRQEVSLDLFDITYENNTDVGTATMIISAKAGSGFAGSKRVTFKIEGALIKNVTVDSVADKVYDGTHYEPALTVKMGDKTLTKGEDYTVIYSKNQAVGTGSATIVGMGGYTGTKVVSFKITAFDVQNDKKHLLSINDGEDISVVFTKGGAKPVPVVKFNGRTLKEKTDYTVAYANTGAVATKDAVDAKGKSKAPTMTLTFKGNLKGKVSVAYTITVKDLDSLNAKVVMADKVYGAKAGAWKQTAATITDTDGKKLAAGKDFKIAGYYKEVECENAFTDADTAADVKVYVKLEAVTPATGAANYVGSTVVCYRIASATIGSAKVTIPAQVYNGKAICPTADKLTVMVGKDTLVAGRDFEIVPGSYVNNVNKGSASLTIRGIGNYSGTKTAKYTIGTKLMVWWTNLFN